MSVSNTFSGKLPSNYEEVLYWRIAQRASRILVMNLFSIPLAFVFGIVFLILVLTFGKPPEIIASDSTQTAILLAGILLVVVIHELAHGVAMQVYGAQPKYGVIWKGLMFYATAPGYTFPRNQYLVVSLAPLVSLSIIGCVGILLQAGTSNVWLWAVWATINGSAAIGDLWITAITLRYPAYAYIMDDGTEYEFSFHKVKAESSENAISLAPNTAPLHTSLCRRSRASRVTVCDVHLMSPWRHRWLRSAPRFQAVFWARASKRRCLVPGERRVPRKRTPSGT